MANTTLEEKAQPLCWLRRSPSNLDISMHSTYDSILEAVQSQRWFPPNCHYCAYRPKHVDDFERHVVKKHAGKLAYSGPVPENTTKALYIVEAIEEELILRKGPKSNNKKKKRSRE